MWILVTFTGVLLLIIAMKISRIYVPAKIFALFWLFQILLTIILFNQFLIFDYYGLLYISFAVLVFILGFITSNKFKITHLNHSEQQKVNQNKLLVTLVLILCCSFISPLQTLINNGFNLSSLLDFQSLLETNKEMSLSRYGDGQQTHSALGGFLLTFTYAAPLWGGYVYLLLKRYRILSILTIFPVIIVALTQAMKMGLIAGVIAWISGFAVCIVQHKIQFDITLKKVLSIIGIALIFLLILFFSMILRIGKVNVDVIELVANKFISYSLGHLPAFDLWFSDYLNNPTNHTYGLKTFFGISNYLGLLSREQGLYTDVYQISVIGNSTNVFSIFRILIEDFGVIGSLIYIYIISICCHTIYRFVVNSLCINTSVTLLSAVYFSIGWSFATSAFAYTSYIAMFFIFYCLFRFCNTRIHLRNNEYSNI